MLFKGKNINVKDANIDYISFGKGEKYLIIIPGLGDGIKTVKGMTFPYTLKYQKIAKKYKVFIFSRRNNLVKDFSIKDMAEDIVNTMNLLNIKKASFLGISQGGMIAQEMAINYPQKIEKLILTVTSSRPNKMINVKVSKWIEYAQNQNYKSIVIDSIENSYSKDFINKYRKYYNIVAKFSEPKDYERFIIQANACLRHNSYDELNKIKLPTLIIGAENDTIVGVDSSKEIANEITNSELYIYPNYGHAVYIEAKDFNDILLEFLEK